MANTYTGYNMKPDPGTFNPDKEYLKELIRRTQLPNDGFARACGINKRTLRYWLSGKHKFNYRDQYTMEALARYKSS